MLHGGGWHGGHGGLDDDDRGEIYNHHVVKRLFPYFSSDLGIFTLAVLMMLIYIGTTVATPWLIGFSLKNYVFGGGDLAGLNNAAIIFCAIVVANYIGNYFYLAILGKISQNVLYKLRTSMFDHLQALSVPFFDRNEVGRVMSRVMSDVNQLQEFLPMVALTLGDFLSLGGIVVVMFLMNFKLALITFITLPILFIIMAVWQKYARTAFIRVRYAISVVNNNLQQNISGIRVVQSFNRENLNLKQFDRVNKDHLDANIWAIKLSAMLMPSVEIVTAAALGLVIIFGGAMVLNNELNPAFLIAFAMYIQRFFDPIRSLTMQYTQFQRAMTAGVRIFELLDVQPEITDKPQAVAMPSIKGDIVYDHVWFEYKQGVPVLRDVNLHIKAGQTAALVGQTGAGKTSMIALATRFYDVTSGGIAIDGYDTRDVTRESLTSQMGMVLQEPFLFSDSVASNIRYKNRDASIDSVREAATAVGAHDFIMGLEDGYETILHERGGNLSIGQRQLISFARAILAEPKILILDEATANIDTFTEILIQRALNELLKERTAIVIAHRLSTIQNADMIVVMERGEILDIGSHDELMERSPIYSRLYALNFEDSPNVELGPLAEDVMVAEAQRRRT